MTISTTLGRSTTMTRLRTQRAQQRAPTLANVNHGQEDIAAVLNDDGGLLLPNAADNDGGKDGNDDANPNIGGGDGGGVGDNGNTWKGIM